MGFGYLGINPFAVQWYLNKEGFTTKIVLDSSSIKSEIHSSIAGILFYSSKEKTGFVGVTPYDSNYTAFFPNGRTPTTNLLESETYYGNCFLMYIAIV